jgi:hypothetical protein
MIICGSRGAPWVIFQVRPHLDALCEYLVDGTVSRYREQLHSLLMGQVAGKHDLLVDLLPVLLNVLTICAVIGKDSIIRQVEFHLAQIDTVMLGIGVQNNGGAGTKS